MSSSRPRRDRILDTAIEVIAGSGLRGLTHRAVDRAAGLPEGSSSAYFRTRQSLLVATAAHVGAALRSDVEELTGHLADQDPASEESVRLVVHQLTTWLTHPARPLARLELTLEGTRNPEVAAVLQEGRDRLEAVASRALGFEEGPASRTVVAALDGLLLGALPLGRRQRVRYLSEGVSVLATVLPTP